MLYRSLLLSALLGCAPQGTADTTPTSDERQGNEINGNAIDVVDLAKQADAVFSGEVTQIDYRLSEPDSAGIALPFTFVTYKVERGFMGSPEEGKEVTLRFFGGPSEGRLLLTSEYPNIDVGDRMVVFAQDNGLSGVPLVNGREGLLRLAKEAVYTEAGYAVTLEDGAIGLGEFVLLEESKSQQVGEIPIEIVYSDVDPIPGPSAVKEDKFFDELAKQLQGMSPSMPFENADPNKSIQFSSQL